MTEPAGGPSDQGHCAEARGDGERLERPQRAGQPERSRGVADEREQRTVGRVLEGPADERQDLVVWSLGGHVGVRVVPVQRAQPCEAHVAEHVLGDQRGAEQQDRMRGEDRRDDRAHRQSARGKQHDQVARAHDQREGLEAARVDAHVQTLQGAGEPARPTAAATRHVLRRFARRSGARQEDRREQAEQAERSERSEPSPDRRCASWGRLVRAFRTTAAARAAAVDLHAGQGRCAAHRFILTSTPTGRRTTRKVESPSSACNARGGLHLRA